MCRFPFSIIVLSLFFAIGIPLFCDEGSELNYPEQEIKVMPWSRAYKDALENDNHVLFTMLRTDDRKSLFKWVGPIYMAKNILFTSQDSPIELNSLNDANDYTIGTILGDASNQLLIDSGIDGNRIETVRTLEQNLKKLELGRIDMISHSNISLNYFLKTTGTDAHTFKILYAFDERGCYFAFNKNIPDSLIEEFQKALNNLTFEHGLILDEYLGENRLN